MGKTKVQTRQTCLGVADFVELPMKSTPEWATIALEGSFATASAAVKSVCRPKKVWMDPEIRFQQPLRGDGPHAEFVSASALVGHSGGQWAILVRSVGFRTLSLSYTVRQEARELSERLQSRTVMFTAERTSDCIGYEVYDKGTLLEMAEWDPTGFVYWGSKLREKPNLTHATVEFADELFRHYGIYVPGCYVGGDPNRPHLCLLTRSKQCIDSVLLVAIRDRRTPPFPKLLAMRQEKLEGLPCR